jgi:radical SAM enzyme (TIGR01210 family)
MMGRKNDPERRQRPEALWKEKDQIDGRTVEAMVLILRTAGCKWYRNGGCLMCGYHSASEDGVGIEDLRMQIGSALERYDGEGMVKIYTSGSFLDTGEIPTELRGEIFETVSESQRILFESRPEFVNIHNLDGIDMERAHVAIGLETSSDLVREACVNKGFTFRDYEKAAILLSEKGIPLRTYLLLKPPFLTEKEAIRDAISSIEDSSRYSESISINPVNVQRDTLVERLWRRGDYRPPWWWSLYEVLLKGLEVSDTRILSAPSGAGTPRGIHNCGECDDKFIEAVQRFSFEQDLGVLRDLRCNCREEWETLIDVQDVMETSVDVSRYLSSNED